MIVLVGWMIALLVFYHKIFAVYYFDLGHGLLRELGVSFILGLLMTALTFYLWWLTAVIIIIAGLGLKKKVSNNIPLIIAIVLAIVISMIGISDKNNTDSNSAATDAGPVRKTVESGTFPSAAEKTGRDLAFCADYTEDELVRALGCEKNEYGIYPSETHANFTFMDGKIYLIMIREPEDRGMLLCGVSLQDSMEEADATLKDHGFICEGSFEAQEAAGDGSSGMVDISVISYTESATGYSYYIRTDAGHNIISLSYGLEAEEPAYAEGAMAEGDMAGEITETAVEEWWNPVTEPLTYGIYSCEEQAGTFSTADIGFYTDEDGGDYITIDCWRNDREIVWFSGMLEEAGEGYYAHCEDIDTVISVIFADGGLYVEVVASEFADIESIEGFYDLTEALNLDEVG